MSVAPGCFEVIVHREAIDYGVLSGSYGTGFRGVFLSLATQGGGDLGAQSRRSAGFNHSSRAMDYCGRGSVLFSPVRGGKNACVFFDVILRLHLQDVMSCPMGMERILCDGEFQVFGQRCNAGTRL